MLKTRQSEIQIEKPTQSGIIADVLILMEQLNRPVTFRDLIIRLPDSVGAQDIWNGLRYLQETMAIESVRISNKKRGYKVQYHILNGKNKVEVLDK